MNDIQACCFNWLIIKRLKYQDSFGSFKYAYSANEPYEAKPALATDKKEEEGTKLVLGQHSFGKHSIPKR
jgi:hypothetical protein